MAKNKNQNRRREQRGERQRQPAEEPREQAPGGAAEEHAMPAATQFDRRQQKRFGHN